MHRKCATSLRGASTKAGMLDQKLGDALELEQKPLRHEGTGVIDIKVQRIGQILFCA